MDSDCPSRLACMQETCRDPCPALSPCGRNAECSVQNTAPSRTMVCMCRPGYVGDANVACNLRKTFTWANTLYIFLLFLFQLCCIVLLFSCLAVGGLIGLLVYLGKQFILSSQNFFIALKV